MKRARTVSISLSIWRGHRVGMRGLVEIVLAPPRDRLVEKSEIAGGLDIVAERLERPDDDVAMRLPVLHHGIGLEHEPLRPVAALFVLLREEDAQDLLDRPIVLEREQKFDRALADVARAPGAAGILFEAVRRGEMDHGVVREPREDRVDGERVRGILGALHPNAAREVAPEAVGRLEHRGFVDRPRVFCRQRLGLLRVGHRAHDREREFVRRPRAHRGISAAAALAVGIQQFVAADGLDPPGRAGHEMIDGFGILLAPAVIEIRPEREALPPRVDLDAASMRILLFAKDEMAEHEKPASWPFDGNAPLHRRLVAANRRRDRDGSLGAADRSSGNR